MEKIDSQKHPVIALLREITTEDGRRRAGRFFAEGEELSRRAFDYGGSVEALVLTDRFAGTEEAADVLERAASAGAAVYCASEGLIAKTLGAKPTPACIAIALRKVASISEALSGRAPLVQMVENGDNADNLGMLLRSTDAAGVSGVILSGETTDPFARRVVRGSRGAIFTLPICIYPDSAKAIAEARGRGIHVVATSARADVPHTEVDYTVPTMFVAGSEHFGISDAVRGLADVVVRVPMFGKVNSLNIAVAASVVLYEAVRQRKPDRNEAKLSG
jgi:TrmH family RNA methyltransferase